MEMRDGEGAGWSRDIDKAAAPCPGRKGILPEVPLPLHPICTEVRSDKSHPPHVQSPWAAGTFDSKRLSPSLPQQTLRDEALCFAIFPLKNHDEESNGYYSANCNFFAAFFSKRCRMGHWERRQREEWEEMVQGELALKFQLQVSKGDQIKGANQVNFAIRASDLSLPPKMLYFDSRLQEI